MSLNIPENFAIKRLPPGSESHDENDKGCYFYVTYKGHIIGETEKGFWKTKKDALDFINLRKDQFIENFKDVPFKE